MSTAIATDLLLLGVVTVLGTAVTIRVTPQLTRAAVPLCCRRRVESFVARAPQILGLAVVVAAAGLLGLVR